ncbi:MAG TPA: 2-oxoacid:acceptor oxidoreductase family protein, partial [Casimicrobiaceae bacterium]|nr:2-oxoacid:acceptor oxidoreductase family protein [Casimicrobiaceae bacterium]
REIRLREPVIEPDALIIQDPTLVHQVDLFKGFRPSGTIIVNSARDFDALGLGDFARLHDPARMCTVPATELALKHVRRAVPNAALLGAFSAITGEVRLESVLAAIREKFPASIAEGNVQAARAAYDAVKQRQVAHA